MSRRRWFRFSLRTMLVVLMVFGAWLGVQIKWIKARNEAQRHCFSYSPDGMRALGIGISYHPKAPLSLRLLGQEGVFMIVIPYDGKYTIAELKQLFPEAPEVQNQYPHRKGDPALGK